MEHHIFHSGNKIFFSIERRNRRTTSIQVSHDQSVRVLAPKFSSQRAICRMVEEKASWIIKKQREFSERPQAAGAPNYISGEQYFYLGKAYELEIKEGRPGVSIDGVQLVMEVPAGYDAPRRRRLLQSWYRTQSECIFEKRMECCVKTAALIGINEAPEWKSRVLKRSWGSCSGKGRINLNIELVSAPLPCIDYVILHELCHLIEHNHSPRFYRLMEKVCPDWKARRDELRLNYQTRLV